MLGQSATEPTRNACRDVQDEPLCSQKSMPHRSGLPFASKQYHSPPPGPERPASICEGGEVQDPSGRTPLSIQRRRWQVQRWPHKLAVPPLLWRVLRFVTPEKPQLYLHKSLTGIRRRAQEDSSDPKRPKVEAGPKSSARNGSFLQKASQRGRSPCRRPPPPPPRVPVSWPPRREPRHRRRQQLLQEPPPPQKQRGPPGTP